jgi:hypothetical protein
VKTAYFGYTEHACRSRHVVNMFRAEWPICCNGVCVEI